MQEPELLDNGKIRIPVRVNAGGIIGDGFEDIGPDDPRFAEWRAYLAELKKMRREK